MARPRDDGRQRCKRCGEWFLAEIHVGKNKTKVGECMTPLCQAMAHYTDDEWEGKARMAAARVGVDDIEILHSYDSDDKLRSTARAVARQPSAFDDEALRRFPR